MSPKGEKQGDGGRAGGNKGKKSESLKTTDHDTIRKWVEARGGKPASVKNTKGDDDPGLLRIDYPDRGAEDTLEDILWDEFFEKFEEKKLAFLYQEETAQGDFSRFSKFVSRD